MPSLVVDTNVVSFDFKGDSRADLYHPLLAGKMLVISFMTIAELDLWALERRWDKFADRGCGNILIAMSSTVSLDRSASNGPK